MVVAIFRTYPAGFELTALPIWMAVALERPKRKMKASWVTTLTMLLAATTDAPIRPKMAACTEVESPQAISLKATGRLVLT